MALMELAYTLEALIGLSILPTLVVFNVIAAWTRWALYVIDTVSSAVIAKFDLGMKSTGKRISDEHGFSSTYTMPEASTPRRAKPLPVPDNSFATTSTESFEPDSSFDSPNSPFVGYAAIRAISKQFEGRPLSSTPFRNRPKSSSILNPSRATSPSSSINAIPSDTTDSPPYSFRQTSSNQVLPHLQSDRAEFSNVEAMSRQSLGANNRDDLESDTAMSPGPFLPLNFARRSPENNSPLIVDLSCSSTSSSSNSDVFLDSLDHTKSLERLTDVKLASQEAPTLTTATSRFNQANSRYVPPQQRPSSVPRSVQPEPSKLASPRLVNETAIGTVVLQGADSAPFESRNLSSNQPTSFVIRRSVGRQAPQPLASSHRAVTHATLPPKPSQAVLSAAGYPRITSTRLRPTAEPFRPCKAELKPKLLPLSSPPLALDQPSDTRWDEEISMITSEKDGLAFIPVMIPTVDRTALTRRPGGKPEKSNFISTSAEAIQA